MQARPRFYISRRLQYIRSPGVKRKTGVKVKREDALRPQHTVSEMVTLRMVGYVAATVF